MARYLTPCVLGIVAAAALGCGATGFKDVLPPPDPSDRYILQAHRANYCNNLAGKNRAAAKSYIGTDGTLVVGGAVLGAAGLTSIVVAQAQSDDNRDGWETAGTAFLGAAVTTFLVREAFGLKEEAVVQANAAAHREQAANRLIAADEDDDTTAVFDYCLAQGSASLAMAPPAVEKRASASATIGALREQKNIADGVYAELAGWVKQQQDAASKAEDDRKNVCPPTAGTPTATPKPPPAPAPPPATPTPACTTAIAEHKSAESALKALQLRQARADVQRAGTELALANAEYEESGESLAKTRVKDAKATWAKAIEGLEKLLSPP